MSYFCVYEVRVPATLYDPPEAWCELGDYDCENCPHRCSKEDFDAMRADDMYEDYMEERYYG